MNVIRNSLAPVAPVHGAAGKESCAAEERKDFGRVSAGKFTCVSPLISNETNCKVDAGVDLGPVHA